MNLSVDTWQWILVIGSSILLFLISPWAKTKSDFFKGSKQDQEPGFWMLTSSLVISWLFAKSITNAANLGLAYGMVGGVSYAVYYLSFIVAGVTIYYLRVNGKFQSLHHFLETKFGRKAILVFSILIAFRLLNEVWSNTMVIGSYFGDSQSVPYYLAILVFILLTLAYTLKGGLRSSLLTDAIQMILFAVLLVSILSLIFQFEDQGVQDYISSGEWSSKGGINLLLVALLQVFSYPYHDPVMTDRAFIASPSKTLRSFVLATVIGGLSIILFSFVGIFGSFQGVSGQAPVEVAKFLGPIMMLSVNFIMITSAASTLDSSFNSFGKLAVIDLNWGKDQTLSSGRWMISLGCLLGTIPIFFNPEILSATTISGTMVIGLTPVFALWFLKVPKMSFHLSVSAGVLIGILHVVGFKFPTFGMEGPYQQLLFANLFGVLICFSLYLFPLLFLKEERT